MSRRVSIALLALVVVLGASALAFVLLRAPEPPPAPPGHGSETRVIGASVQGRPIAAYSFGAGPTHLLFVGGIHGGYEWNSVLLAYQFFDYLTAHPEFVPAQVTITIIPSLNPDGVYRVVGKEGRFVAADVSGDETLGRFNAHSVDLNRNFDCKWQPTSTWRSKEVSAGSAPFSEPEAQALRSYILEHQPSAVVFWHSQSNAVYASECEEGILPATRAMMNVYAQAAGYPAIDVFDAYAITGDAEGWLASIGIPAITVELQTHETIEWERNLRGVEALFSLFSRE